MNANQKSCVSQLPTQRNRATLENSATSAATVPHQIARKPASIQELRAQLQAQQGRNQSCTGGTIESPKVAHDIASNQKSCAETLLDFEKRNRATQADGPFTPWSPPVSPALVIELHRLIAEYSRLYRIGEDATARIIDVAKRQSLASVPASLSWFRSQIGGRQ
jgi:hypothetical protein